MLEIGRIVRSELVTMCSDKCNSILRQQSSEYYVKFSWQTLYEELKINTPLLLCLLEACTQTRRSKPNRIQIIGMCTAMLLKYRFGKMSLVQRIISIVLRSGHSNKLVGMKCMYIMCMCKIDFFIRSSSVYND